MVGVLLIEVLTGSLHVLGVNDIPAQRSESAHNDNLPTAIDFGRRAGAQLPVDEDIILQRLGHQS